ncbi:hypothetical protein Plhal703r1_c06g0032201 [Plasmopara halstedii]
MGINEDRDSSVCKVPSVGDFWSTLRDIMHCTAVTRTVIESLHQIYRANTWHHGNCIRNAWDSEYQVPELSMSRLVSCLSKDDKEIVKIVTSFKKVDDLLIVSELVPIA